MTTLSRRKAPGLAIVTPAPARAESREVPSPQEPMAVARELVKHLFTGPDGLVLRDHRGDFFQWTGTHWPEVDRRDIRAAAYTFLEHACYLHPDEGRKPFAPSRRKIDDVVDALRAVVLVDSRTEAPTWITSVDTLPPARDCIAMTNGILHVPTRMLRPQTPNYFAHHALPFAFDPAAPAPVRWLRFLDELWPDDGSAINALQEVFGYIVSGDTRQQKIFLLNGPKRGGKGTIGRVLTGLLGVHNVAAPTLASLSTNFGLSPLIGKPLALVSDARLSTKADSKIVVERLLSVSGEDSLTVDRKYREPWTGRLAARFMVLTNELPRLTDASGALASRFVVFVLTRSFYGQEDPALTDALLTEVSGIFSWSLAGLDRLTARGYFVTPASGREAVQQLEDLSSPISAFIRDRCTVGADQSVEVDTLWAAWKTWCSDDNRHPGTKALFGRDLRSALPRLKKMRPRTDGDRDHVYQGIGVGTTVPGHHDHCDHGPAGHSGHSDLPMYSSREEAE